MARAQLVALGFDTRAIAYGMRVTTPAAPSSTSPTSSTSQLTPERGATRSHLEDSFVRFGVTRHNA